MRKEFWLEHPDGSPLTRYRLCSADFDDDGRETGRHSMDIVSPLPPRSDPAPEPEPEPTPEPEPEPEPVPEPVPDVDLKPTWSERSDGFRLRLPGGVIPRDTPAGTEVGEFINGALRAGSPTWFGALESGAGSADKSYFDLPVPNGERRPLVLAQPLGSKRSVSIRVERRDGSARADAVFVIPVV